jgi:tetratricopeptide (TPR) repeat protein
MNSSLHEDCNAAYELAKHGEYERALDVCEELMARHPDRLEPLRTHASIQMHKGDFSAAEADLRLLTERGTSEPADYYDLGRASFQQKNYQAAIEALTKAVEAGEKASFKYYEQASLLLRAEARLRINDRFGAVSDCRRAGPDYVGYVPGIGPRRAADIIAAAGGSGR